MALLFLFRTRVTNNKFIFVLLDFARKGVTMKKRIHTVVMTNEQFEANRQYLRENLAFVKPDRSHVTIAIWMGLGESIKAWFETIMFNMHHGPYAVTMRRGVCKKYI